MCCREDDTNGHTVRNRSLHLPHLAPETPGWPRQLRMEDLVPGPAQQEYLGQLDTSLNLRKYRMRLTELLRLGEEDCHELSCIVTVERQNEVRVKLEGARASVRPGRGGHPRHGTENC